MPANCPLCNSSQTTKRFRDAGYDVLRCRNCELLFIDPYPSEAEVRTSVGAVKHSSEASLKDRYAAEVAFYDEHFDAIHAHCAGTKSLLEVGCGTGRLLELMRAAGLACVGVELDPARAEAARVRSGCVVHVTPVEELNSDTAFDVVTMINVLSHIPSLPSLFPKLKALLSERGRLILMAGEMTADVERGDAVDWAIPTHMHFLGFGTIEFICREFGFQIVAHERTPYSASLFSQARFRAPGRSRLRNMLKSIILRFPFALRTLRWWYDRTRGSKVVTSLIVLSPQRPAAGAG
jgi:SAM-dependent methyltransferase